MNLSKNVLIKLLFLTLILTIVVANALPFLNTSPGKPSIANGQKIFGWGNNTYGQVTDKQKETFIPITRTSSISDSSFVDFAAGSTFSHFLDSNGDVYSRGDNRLGQLGQDSILPFFNELTKIKNLPKITKIKSNISHTLALDVDGKIWAWGNNTSGQLGIGNNENAKKPVMIKDLENVDDIFIGGRFSLAKQKNGKMYIWGGSCATDKTIKFDQFLQNVAANVTSGGYFDQSSNNIESNTQNDCVLESQTNMNINSNRPIAIPSLDNMLDVSGGFGHILALDKSGNVFSFGCNKYGQVGNGTNINDVQIQTPKQIPNLPKIKAISAGYRHSLLLSNDGAVFGFGHNQMGALTTDKQDQNFNPIIIPTSGKVKKILAGYDYSLLQMQNGSVFGAGENHSQLLTSLAKDKASITKLIELKIDNNTTDFRSGEGFVLASQSQNIGQK
jgi:alpha-tubulin suppressor-like RCC1 family protein